MKILVLLAFVAVATASSSYFRDNYGPGPYNFRYAVKDAHFVDFGHQESRTGDNAKGTYFVVLPDGRKQTVQYTANDNEGYLADVQYSGGYTAYDTARSAYPRKL